MNYKRISVPKGTHIMKVLFNKGTVSTVLILLCSCLFLISAKGGCWDKENKEKLTAGSSGVNDLWLPMSESSVPSGVAHFSAVWIPPASGLPSVAGEMLVWGGAVETGDYSANGGRYQMPASNEEPPWGIMTISLGKWATVNQTGAPFGRGYHTAVWTGTPAQGGTGEMLVWGGFDADNFMATGARYNQLLDVWSPISSTDAPTARAGHSAIWIGNGVEPWRNQMLIWGGDDGSGAYNPGAAYKPVVDTWTTITTVNMPNPRAYHTAVWTGTQMIVWGGSKGSSVEKSGGIYDPTTDTWSNMVAPGALAARTYHTAVWSTTTDEMIIWGGRDQNGNPLNTGGRYDLTLFEWTSITATGITARWGHTTVWTGTEMIIWGGVDDQGNHFNDGAAYNPVTDSWRTINHTGSPTSRVYHRAVWTGTEMIIWGGWNGLACLNTGARYKP